MRKIRSGAKSSLRREAQALGLTARDNRRYIEKQDDGNTESIRKNGTGAQTPPPVPSACELPSQEEAPPETVPSGLGSDTGSPGKQNVPQGPGMETGRVRREVSLKIQQSAEDYLETILVFKQTQTDDTSSIDIVNELDFPSHVSIANEKPEGKRIWFPWITRDISLWSHRDEICRRFKERHTMPTGIAGGSGVNIRKRR